MSGNDSSRSCVVSLAFLLGAALTTPAHAQQAGQPMALPGVVVTATATPRPVTDLISDIDTAPVAGARRDGAASMVDLLGALPGFDLVSNGGPGSTSAVLLRGASAGQSLLLIDGFRVSSVSLGQPTFEALPMMLTDRVEVLRGPASGLYGADALGGVIQLFSMGSRVLAGPEGELALGGLGSQRALLGYGLSNGKGLGAQLRISRERSDGFNASRPGAFQFNADRDGFSRDGAMLSLGADLASGASWRAIYLQNDVDTDYDDGAFDGARVLGQVRLAGLTAEQEMPDGGLWQLRIGRSSDRSETISSFPGVYESTQDQIGVVHTRPLGPGVEMRFAFEHLSQSLAASTYTAPSRSTDGYTLALTGREGAHIVQLSVRRDDSNQFENQTHGTLAYGYVTDSGWRLGGSASTGFRAPSFNDLYYPGYGRAAVRPESARSLELGAYLDPQDPARDGWRAKLVIYRNAVEDLIVYAPVCPDPAPQYAFGCADNVNNARLLGAALSLSSRHGAWQWRIDADFADPRDRTLQKRLARRATRQLSASLAWSRDVWRLGARAKLVGSRFDDQANTRVLAGYGLIDLSGARRLGKDWELFLSVSNAGDRDYTTAAGFAQQGRLVMAGVRYPAR